MWPACIREHRGGAFSFSGGRRCVGHQLLSPYGPCSSLIPLTQLALHHLHTPTPSKGSRKRTRYTPRHPSNPCCKMGRGRWQAAAAGRSSDGGQTSSVVSIYPAVSWPSRRAGGSEEHTS